MGSSGQHIHSFRKTCQDQAWMEMFFATFGTFVPGFEDFAVNGYSNPAQAANKTNAMVLGLRYGFVPSSHHMVVTRYRLIKETKNLGNTCRAGSTRVLHWAGREKPWCVAKLKDRTIFENYWWNISIEVERNLTAARDYTCRSRSDRLMP